jgi:hypothetical protein
MPIEPSPEALQAAYAAAGLTHSGDFPQDHPSLKLVTPQPAQHSDVAGVAEHPSSFFDGQRQTVLGVEKRPAFSDTQVNDIAQSIIDARIANATARQAPPDEIERIRAEAVAEVEAALQADGYDPLPDDPRSEAEREYDDAMAPPEDGRGYDFDWSRVDLPPGELAELDAEFRELGLAIGLPAQQGAIFTGMVNDTLDFEAMDTATQQTYLQQQHDILIRLCGGLEGAREAFAKGYDLLNKAAPDVVKALEGRGGFRSASTVMALANLADAVAYRASLTTKA